MITVVGLGGHADGTGPIAPGVPFDTQVNDFLVAFLEADNEGAISMFGWSPAPNSPAVQGADEGTRLTVFWKRATGPAGSDSTNTSDSGNHQSGRILGLRGVKTTGDPWEATAKSIGDETSTVSIPSISTSSPDAFVVMGVSGADPNGDFGPWSNPNLVGLLERSDVNHDRGNGGCMAIITGVKATPGVTGPTTSPVDSDEEWAAWIGALTPEPVVVVSSEEPLPGVQEIHLTGSLTPFGQLSNFIDNNEVEPSPALSIDTWQWDTPPDLPEDRDNIDYYIAWQMADQSGENIDKIIKAVRITAKANNPQVQIHAASPGQEIDKNDLESGTGARAVIHFEDSNKVTRYKREKVRIRNLSIWAARFSGSWNGENERDRLDEIIMEGDSHGTKR